jgi:outer membrane protein assembly factor BamB
MSGRANMKITALAAQGPARLLGFAGAAFSIEVLVLRRSLTVAALFLDRAVCRQQSRDRQGAFRCPNLQILLATVLAALGILFQAQGQPVAAGQIAPKQGLCVVLGDPQCELALKLARETELLLYLQFADPQTVEAARRQADAAGFYGTRIFIEQGPANRLYLADNLADALIAAGPAAGLPEAEALRVLHPRGKALLGQKELVKPVPAGVDDWSHFYHGPDNNPLSRDQVARGPYLTQFLADPRYAPLPQIAVASAGRVFKLFGHIAFKEREEPWLDTMAAFNGYNGAFLWRRPIAPALMVHRSTFIATPDKLYFGDDKSCKVLDAATGELRDEIAPPAEQAGGTFWKWMALEKGVLYALLGEQERRDPVLRTRSESHGWPWDPLSPGFNRPEHDWGFGRTLLAIDPPSKKILWRYQENEPIDSRALCMKNGRIYLFRFGTYLACLAAEDGKVLWRKTPANAPELFKSLGQYSKRQDWRTNWRTAAYLKCSDQALYFAGTPIEKLLAVAADTGRLLWEHPYNNYQLILREDGVYGLPGQIDNDPARKFDLLTGKVLEEVKLGRRACTRPTGSIDAIFCRAGEGSVRLDMARSQPQLVSPMRPNCQDGVTIANGLLYWWPSVCDCNLTLYGITCLAPAGHFDYSQNAVASERLEVSAKDLDKVAELPVTAADWPVFRANSTGTVATEASVPENVNQIWKAIPNAPITPTALVAAGDLVFLGGSDGIVRVLNARTGRSEWKAYTGGAIRFPPTIWQGRALVGSGDGWVYAYEAKTGRLLWRFRAAPVERRIPVYGTLQSTWPAASGVLVADGTAYVAAGIVNYDGTHVYALDAATGRLKWQNNTSGHIDPEQRTGVSVQGHLMLARNQLYLPGGNAVSPAIYDLTDGACRSDPKLVHQTVNNNCPASLSPRGSELYWIANQVRVSGKPFYAHPKYAVYDDGVLFKTLLASAGDRTIAWVNNAKLLGYDRTDARLEEKLVADWGKRRGPSLKALWEQACNASAAVAVGRNAVVVAKPAELTAFALSDGRPLWSQPLPAAPVPWGLALTRDGRVLVALETGSVLCFQRPSAP